ncbi:MAG TPA: VWA domain-containing protein [Vicinamibacteria bacterium]|nr:VWA domain-containing protein [Vicinamibacteria bacterium]
MKKAPSTVLVVLLSVAATSPPARAQSQPQVPTFATAIEMINLNISVADDHQGYVKGLSRDDFVVYEDGVPQQLTVFGQDDVPISLALMIDGSSSMEEKLKSAQDAAVAFTRTLQPGDEAQVIQFNQRTTILQPFTGDHAALEAAIRKTEASGTTALHTALYVTLKDLRADRRQQLRRRAIVLLTDGEDTASAVSDDQVLELARKSDINIYAVSLRPNAPEARAQPSWAQAEYLLTSLARDTGGRAYFPSALGEIRPVYARIAEELRTLYTVGYTPSSSRHDGKWRRIQVRVPNREGLSVRHKLGYYAPTS